MNTLALDIGGANIKAAHSRGGAWSLPFALYREPERLGEMLESLTRPLPAFDRVLLTTTAELCDCFPTKREGVARIVQEVRTFAGPRPVRIWATGLGGRFVSPDEAVRIPLEIGAGNWHAQATLLALQSKDDGLGLLVDTGSTTTDLIRLRDGRAEAKGLTDMARLESGELVYVGARRTALLAFGPTAKIGGKQYGIMNELFADLADVHLLLGHLPEEPTNHETWDRQAFTRPRALARVVRMIGADLEMVGEDEAIELARFFADAAAQRVVDGIDKVLGLERPDFVIVSGSGEFMAIAAVREAIGPHVPIRRLSDLATPEASEAACAYALLKLEAFFDA